MISEIIMVRIMAGIEYLTPKYVETSKAIAVTGVAFGTCGNNRTITPTPIRAMILMAVAPYVLILDLR